MTHPTSRTSEGAPSSILTADDIKSVLAIYDDPSFSEETLLNLLASAEEHLESLIYSPLQMKVVRERYPYLARWVEMRIRPIGSSGFGEFGAPDYVQGGDENTRGKPSIIVSEDDGDRTLDPNTYRVDVSDYTPRLVFSDAPTASLSRDVANPVLVSYTYQPAVPSRVRHALEQVVRAYFNARNAGMPFPDVMLHRTLRGELTDILPKVVGAYH